MCTSDVKYCNVEMRICASWELGVNYVCEKQLLFTLKSFKFMDSKFRGFSTKKTIFVDIKIHRFPCCRQYIPNYIVILFYFMVFYYSQNPRNLLYKE